MRKQEGSARRRQVRLVAHGLHLPARRRLRRKPGWWSPTAGRRHRVRSPPRCTSTESSTSRRRSSATASGSSGHGRRLAEADDPVTSMTVPTAAARPVSTPPTLNGFWSARTESSTRLGELGCTYLQVDDTSLASNDPHRRDYITSVSASTWIHPPHQAFLAERPSGVTTHMCRTTHAPSWAAEGRYDLERLNELEVDGFFIDQDGKHMSRCGSSPRGTSRSCSGRPGPTKRQLESKDELKRHEEASKYGDIDELCLSPQCGFSSTVEGNVLKADAGEARADRRGHGIVSRTSGSRRRGLTTIFSNPGSGGAVPCRPSRRPPVRPRPARGLCARAGDTLAAASRRSCSSTRPPASATPSAASRRRGWWCRSGVAVLRAVRG